MKSRLPIALTPSRILSLSRPHALTFVPVSSPALGSPRRPAELAPGEEVQMQVEHALPGLRAVVDDDAE